MEEKLSPVEIKSENLIQKYSVISETDDPANPRDSVVISYGNTCGAGGRSAILNHNNHANRGIGVTIEIRYVYQGQNQSESRLYNIFPGQQVDLGCTVPGPTQQRFNYFIVGAWFL
ncbi:hypothetical protein [Flavobacterium sp.]|uniref:hypothetical protein n=1 Tax=Flavobacterium sp. TaxID=239 RepID=UPI0040343AEE